jgi:catechol 2,3-dioxygenase-like lactoylglutathione lyase family enzyme
MRVTGVVANLPVADIAAARDFYTHYLGLSVEGFNLGWVARYGSPDGNAFVQLVTRDATRLRIRSSRFTLAPTLTKRTRRPSGVGTRLFTRSPKRHGECGGSLSVRPTAM